jgi:hypothetical protein
MTEVQCIAIMAAILKSAPHASASIEVYVGVARNILDSAKTKEA